MPFPAAASLVGQVFVGAESAQDLALATLEDDRLADRDPVGPYRITETQTGSRLVLEPNPTWWGKPPHFKKVVVQIVESKKTDKSKAGVPFSER